MMNAAGGMSHRICTIGLPAINLFVIWQSYRVNNHLAGLLVCTIALTMLIIIAKSMVYTGGGGMPQFEENIGY